MSRDARGTLRRALRDLDDGMRALLGQELVQLGLIRELLGRNDAPAPGSRPVAVSTSSAGAPHPSHTRRRRARRRPGSPVLVRVK